MSNFVASVEIFRQYHAQKSCGGRHDFTSSSVETQKVGGGYKLLRGIALTMGVAMVLVILFSHRGFYNVFRFRQEGIRLEQENVRGSVAENRPSSHIDRLQHDPEYLRTRIRQELNFVKPNELIFQFPPEKPVTAPNLTAAVNSEKPPPERGQVISEKKSGAAKSVSGPTDGSSKKRASRRRE